MWRVGTLWAQNEPRWRPGVSWPWCEDPPQLNAPLIHSTHLISYSSPQVKTASLFTLLESVVAKPRAVAAHHARALFHRLVVERQRSETATFRWTFRWKWDAMGCGWILLGTPEDSGIALQAVTELGPDFPLFGVCMGHQCIGQVYGGET